MPTLWIPDGSTTLVTPAANYAGIRVPSRTTTQIGSLTPSDGSLIYDSTLGRFKHWSGGTARQWARLDGDTFTGQVVLASTGVSFGSSVMSQASSNVVCQKNGTNAQEFQVYGTSTSSTSYSRMFQGRSDGSYHYIGTEGGSSAGPYCGLKIQVSNPSGVAGDAIVINTQRQCTFPNLTTGSYFQCTQTFVLPSKGTNYFGIRQPSGTQGSLGYGNSINLGTDVISWNDSNQVAIIDGGNVVFGTTTGSQIGTSTTQKLGFWGKTPIVQPQLSTGVSHTVDDVIAIIQNLGLCHQ